MRHSRQRLRPLRCSCSHMSHNLLLDQPSICCCCGPIASTLSLPAVCCRLPFCCHSAAQRRNLLHRTATPTHASPPLKQPASPSSSASLPTASLFADPHLQTCVSDVPSLAPPAAPPAGFLRDPPPQTSGKPKRHVATSVPAHPPPSPAPQSPSRFETPGSHSPSRSAAPQLAREQQSPNDPYSPSL